VAEWDRGRKGAIGRTEFRQGVREDLGLRGLDNAVLDEWFEHMDKDGGGTLDLNELREALGELEQIAQKTLVEREECAAQLAELRAKLESLEAIAARWNEVFEPAIQAAERLDAFRSQAHLAARMGASMRVRTRKSGMNERAIIGEWEASRKNRGSPWMERDEFVVLIAHMLTETKKTPAPDKADAARNKAAPRQGVGQVARPSNPLGIPGQPAKKVGKSKTATARKSGASGSGGSSGAGAKVSGGVDTASAEEQQAWERELARAIASVEQLGISKVDIDAQFAEIDRSLSTSGEVTGKVVVRSTLQHAVKADEARQSEELKIAEQYVQRRDTALKAAATMTDEVDAFLHPRAADEEMSRAPKASVHLQPPAVIPAAPEASADPHPTCTDAPSPDER
jgi:hypothetical protein